MEHPFRRVLRPTPHTLRLGNLSHHDAQEVSTVFAIIQNAGTNRLLLQAGGSKEFASQPRVQQPLSIAKLFQIAKTGDQQIEDVGFAEIDREVPGGNQHVIQQGGARTRAAQYEDRRGTAIDSRFVPSVHGFQRILDRSASPQD